LVGCGLTVPNIKEIWDADKPADAKSPRIPGTAQIEFEIKKRVYCELKRAIQEVNKQPVYSGPPNKKKLLAKYPIPLDWIAQISLSLQVDESSALSPGVTLNTVLPNDVRVFGPESSVTTSQFRNVGFGGTLSSTATRIDKFDPAYTIGYLMIKDSPQSICSSEANDPLRKLGWIPDSSSPLILQGDLGIRDWLFGDVMMTVFLHSELPAGVTDSSQTPDRNSYEIKFIIVSNGNVTPTWQLVRVSANTSGPFFSAGRTRTHDLIITIGPNDQLTWFAHLSSQIGQAVSGGNSALLTPASGGNGALLTNSARLPR
jgi:hypothetical protein